MYLTKHAKQLLNAAIAAQPVIQNCYSGTLLAESINISKDTNIISIIELLEQQECVTRPFSTRPDLFRLTELGKHYKAFQFHLSFDVFKTSILCPIVVTIATEILIHVLPILLKLLLQSE